MSNRRNLMVANSGNEELKGYIQSSGNGEYIDLSSLLRLEVGDILTCTFQTPNIDSVSVLDRMYKNIFGCAFINTSGYYNYVGIMLYARYIYGAGNTLRLTCLNYKSSNYPPVSAEVAEYNSNKTEKITVSMTRNADTYTDGFNLLKGNIDGLVCRIWSANIVRNGVKVLDLVPFVKDGQAGFKDKVSGTFVGNSGTGTLTFVEE